MKKNIFIKRILTFWQNLSKSNAILFGGFMGVITFGIPALIGGGGLATLGMLLYFPFHIWLGISVFLVVFSEQEREKRLGTGYSIFDVIPAYLLTHKYPLFCLSWFFTIAFSIVVHIWVMSL